MDDLLFRIGEVKRIYHKVSSDVAFTLGAITAYIYDDTGAVVINGAAGAGSAGSATEHDVYYVWTPTTAGDYTYLLRYVVGSQTLELRGEVSVVPRTSKFDRWVRRVTDWMLDAEVGEAQSLLSWRQVRDAVLTAAERYSQDKPQKKFNDSAGATLTAGVWEYSLPSDWADQFSYIEAFEYPVDSTVQTRTFLDPDEYYVDELRDKWMFTSISPSASEKARYVYTARHSITDTAPAADTIPAKDFEFVSQYAAGLALLQAANQACRLAAQSQGAEIVNYRTKQQEYSAQAKAMMSAAVASWGGGGTQAAGSVGQMGYLVDHGRVLTW